MENGEDKSKGKDYYQVLGLNKECTSTDLRNAYKKLALRWHPDRCSSSVNSNFVAEEAKKKFQTIQQAYSVLSDDNKRFLYDVGVYDDDDDGENGMGDFLNEMAVMMNQTKPHGNGEESFEELQVLFEEMFGDEIDRWTFEASYQATSCCNPSSSSSSSYVSFTESLTSMDESASSDVTVGRMKAEDSSSSDAHSRKFSLGVEQQQEFKKGKAARGRIRGGTNGGRRRHSRDTAGISAS